MLRKVQPLATRSSAHQMMPRRTPENLLKLVGQNPFGEGWWVSQNMELLSSLQAQLM